MVANERNGSTIASMPRRQRPPQAEPEVLLTDDEWTYRGPLDLDAPSPTVTFRVSRALREGAALALAYERADPVAIDAALREIALPLAAIDVLARRCVDAHREASEALAAGESAPDVRWMRALSRALGAGASTPAGTRARTVVAPQNEQRVMAMCAQGERVVVLSYALAYGQGPIECRLDFVEREEVRSTHTFSTMNFVQRALPRGAHAPAELAWLSLREPDGAVTLQRWSLEGELREARSLRAESALQRVSLAGDQLWLHCDQHHVRTDSSDARASFAHSDPSGGPLIAGGALLTFATRVFDADQRAWLSRSAQWLALDAAREGLSFDWSIPVHRAVVTERGVWLATERGLYFAEPFAAPTCIDARAACYALAARDGRVAYVIGATLTVLDATTRAVERAVDLPIERGRTMYHGTMSEGCVALNDFTRAVVLDHRGVVQWNSGDRREPVAVALADGTTLVSAGELVSAFAKDGARIATNAMPYDGQLLGATREFAIFGPVSGGVARTEPDGLYAIDARARIVDALRKPETGVVARPTRTRYGGGTESDAGLITDDRVLVVDQHGALLAWRPRASSERVFAESQRRPAARGVVETRYHTSNPRDDWPEAGIDLNAVTFYGEECTWRGTTGVCPERAVLLRNGAVATLVRCAIDGAGGGARVTQGSTLILYDCRFDRSQIECEPGSHVLVLSADDH